MNSCSNNTYTTGELTASCAFNVQVKQASLTHIDGPLCDMGGALTAAGQSIGWQCRCHAVYIDGNQKDRRQSSQVCIPFFLLGHSRNFFVVAHPHAWHYYRCSRHHLSTSKYTKPPSLLPITTLSLPTWCSQVGVVGDLERLLSGATRWVWETWRDSSSESPPKQSPIRRTCSLNVPLTTVVRSP